MLRCCAPQGDFPIPFLAAVFSKLDAEADHRLSHKKTRRDRCRWASDETRHQASKRHTVHMTDSGGVFAPELAQFRKALLAQSNTKGYTDGGLAKDRPKEKSVHMFQGLFNLGPAAPKCNLTFGRFADPTFFKPQNMQIALETSPPIVEP